MRKLALLLLAVVLALPVAAAPDNADARSRKVRLKAFRSCSGLVDYAKRHRTRVLGVQQIGGGGGGRVPAPAPGAGGGGSGGMQEDQAVAAPQAGTDFSTTNVQEEGIDEPDIIKTDGRTAYVLRGSKLLAIDVTEATPRLVGSLTLEDGAYAQDMLLRGDRLLVFWTPRPQAIDTPVATGASEMISPYYQSKTVLGEVDVTDPSAPRLVRTLTVDGSVVSARLHGPTARVVVNAPPRAVIAPEEQVRLNRPAAWLPRAVLRSVRTGTTRNRRLVGCSRVRRTATFTGLDTLTILTIDLRKGLAPVDSDGLMTNAETVYASNDSLYVATQRWGVTESQVEGGQPPRATTAIHKFAIDDDQTTTYRASGEVPGYLPSQLGLSERDGVLRTATTEMPFWFGGEQLEQSQSHVTTLREADGRLAKLGQVSGLGRGERIFAVRFIDDIGYVVTFRQTDPLYTVDLGNPAQPRVRGELKILGFSAYLHPIGKDLLLGVGQDATEQGRQLGTQLSVFDVSNLDDPRRTHQYSLGQSSYSGAEWNHHAFLWWAASDLAVIPVSIYDMNAGQYNGAIGFRVKRDAGISEAGRVSHPERSDWMPEIERSLVVGDRLYTLSQYGLKASALSTFTDAGWLEFPTPSFR